jgi:hypothetical protein
MGAATYDLIEVFRRAFGAIPYRSISTNRDTAQAAAFSSIETNEVTSEQRSRLLGTPIFMPCTLDGFQLPNEPLIQISGSKTIIKTPIDSAVRSQERVKGTFKELYSEADDIIIIKGVAVNEDDEDYPEQIVNRIRQLIKKQSELKVDSCRMLSMFGVQFLAIESYDFPTVEGFQNMQPYQLNCVSDSTIDLNLNTPRRSV